MAAYTRGLAIHPTNHVLLSNRAAAYMKLRQHALALEDAQECLQLRPSFYKAYSRCASALLALGRPVDARRVAQQGLDVLHATEGDPSQQSVDILNDVMQSAQRALFIEALTGSWRGIVHEKLGGYEQTFQFEPNQVTQLRDPAMLLYTKRP